LSRLEKARVSARALLSVVPSGAAVGAIIGLALGGAYLAGGSAQDAVTQATVSRLSGAAAQGFSEQALGESIAGRDSSAVALARRFEGSPTATAAAADRQAADLAQRLENKAGKHGLRDLFTNALKFSATPAAAPFQASALDQARELDCLAQAVYYEARGETPAGQAAVAQVVLNRVRHPSFPKSICAVVFQGAQTGRGCQFSFACNGSTHGGRESGAWDRAKRIASRAFDGQVMADVGNATHFHVISVAPQWAGLMRVAQVGAHVFYRFGGRAGAPQAFTVEPRLIEALTEPVAVDAAAIGMAASKVVGDAVKVEAVPAVNDSSAAVKAEPAAKPEAAVAGVGMPATS
jgi:spore germination cell wall hydrolase CwlJ-like protein